MTGGRDNPWGAPPKSRAWRRLASLVIPLAVGAGCGEQTPPGTSTTPGSSTELSPPGTMAVPTGETADTGTP